MGSAVETLVGLVSDEGRHDIPYPEVLPLQLQAATERLESRRKRIRLLANRADNAGVETVKDASDLVPLLFAHNSYKSYAESWLAEGQWERMSRWVGTVSTYPADSADLDGVGDIDGWIERLERIGHFMSCSSGTTGKPGILSCSQDDLAISARMNVASLSWATGVTPVGDRRSFALLPPTGAARNRAIRRGLVAAFAYGHPPYEFPVAPITIGQTTAMIALRRKVADGAALPVEIAEFETLSAGRQAAMDAALDEAVEELIKSRGTKLILNGLWLMIYQIAKGVRERGYSAADFHPENLLVAGGGLKGAVLPPDYKEYVLETFNVSRERLYHFYSMQEINSPMPLCRAERYHVPPWVMLMVLDAAGERVLAPGGGEVEGRAAFFDATLDGRWGGVISGDRVHADYGRCACGAQGPTVGAAITRYADLPGGDKISCAGTIDAYIRGAV